MLRVFSKARGGALTLKNGEYNGFFAQGIGTDNRGFVQSGAHWLYGRGQHSQCLYSDYAARGPARRTVRGIYCAQKKSGGETPAASLFGDAVRISGVCQFGRNVSEGVIQLVT